MVFTNQRIKDFSEILVGIFIPSIDTAMLIIVIDGTCDGLKYEKGVIRLALIPFSYDSPVEQEVEVEILTMKTTLRIYLILFQ